jgi:hypothetical protein
MGGHWVRIKAIVCLGFVAAVLVSAYRVSNTMLNHDVAGFLLDVRAFELGRTLYDSFFEMNMPSNVWLPLVSVDVAKVVPRPLADVHLAVLFLFVLACAGTTLLLVWRIVGPRHAVTMIVASILIPAVFLAYPRYDFGQREALFVATSAPLVAVVLGRHCGYAPALAMSIGVAALAAFGSSQKPYFVVVIAGFLFVDFCLRRGRLLQMGAEVFAFVAFLIGYAAWIALVYPSYLTDTIPTASATYLTMTQPFSVVLAALRWPRLAAFAIVFVVLMSLAVLLRQGRDLGRYLKFFAFWLALVGLSAGIYFQQSHGFFYHQFVLLAVVIISSGLMLAWFVDGLTDTALREISWLGRPLMAICLAVACLGYAGIVARLTTVSPPQMTREAAINDPLTRIMTGLPGGTPVLMLLTNIVPMSPLHAYADIRWTGQFSTLVILRAIYSERDHARAEGREMSPRVAKAERDLRRYVLNSFLGVPPEIVFVEMAKPLRWFEDYPRPVSLLEFLTEQPEFAAEWAKYEKVGEVRSLFDIPVAVFRRREDA